MTMLVEQAVTVLSPTAKSRLDPLVPDLGYNGRDNGCGKGEMASGGRIPHPAK